MADNKEGSLASSLYKYQRMYIEINRLKGDISGEKN